MRRLSLLLPLIVSLACVSCSEDPVGGAGGNDPESGPVIVRGAENWDWIKLGVPEELYSVAGSEFCYGLFGGGSAKISFDGLNWFTRSYGMRFDMLAAAAVNGMTVAVGTGPYGAFFAADASGGLVTNQENTLRALAWSGSIAVAVGDDGELVTSADGRDWVRRPPITDEDLYALAWTGEQFICGGDRGTMYRSADGLSWAAEDTPLNGITGLASTDPGLFAVTRSGGIWRNDTGSWVRVLPDNGIPLRGITGYGSMVVAAGDGASMAISAEGGEWQRWSLDIDTDFRAVTARERIVAIGSNTVLLASEDGMTWEERPPFSFPRLRDIATDGRSYVAAGYGGVCYSPDGREWTWNEDLGIVTVYSVTWAGDRYAACGRDGMVLVSDDGRSWSRKDFPGEGILYSIHWTGTETMIGTDEGTVWITSDYERWEEVRVSSTAILDIAQSPSELVAASGMFVYVSTDGRDWVNTDYVYGSDFYKVIWTGSEFLTLQDDRVSSSEDGCSWTDHDIPDVWGLRGICKSGGRVYVVGREGRILWSEDLSVWNSEASGFEGSWIVDHPGPDVGSTHYYHDFENIVSIGEETLIVGSGGLILRRK